ncbi:MAG: hypothetical protein E6X17_04830 [Sporomusaceae bacterium]|nr:hypothetical protein [Sporomusaceae bacterium]
MAAMKQKSNNTERQREKMHNQAIKSEPAAEKKRTDGTVSRPH